MGNKSETRLGRVNEEIKKAVSHTITFELKNSEVTGLVSVTKVDVSPDLKNAKVYISLLNSKSNTKTLNGLKKSEKFIRSQVAKKVNLRTTPELFFILDDSIAYGDKIENILKDLNKK